MCFLRRLRVDDSRSLFIKAAAFVFMATLIFNPHKLQSQNESINKHAESSSLLPKDRVFRDRIHQHLREGNYEAVLDEMPDLDKRLNELSEEDLLAYTGILVKCYIMLGEYGKASDLIYSATECKGDNLVLLSMRGFVDVINDNYGLAIKSYNRVIELVPLENEEYNALLLLAYVNRACTYAAIDRRDDVIKDIGNIRSIMSHIKKNCNEGASDSTHEELLLFEESLLNSIEDLEKFINNEGNNGLIVRDREHPVIDRYTGTGSKGKDIVNLRLGLFWKFVTIQ